MFLCCGARAVPLGFSISATPPWSPYLGIHAGDLALGSSCKQSANLDSECVMSLLVSDSPRQKAYIIQLHSCENACQPQDSGFGQEWSTGSPCLGFGGLMGLSCEPIHILVPAFDVRKLSRSPWHSTVSPRLTRSVSLSSLVCAHWYSAALYGDSDELLGRWLERTGKRKEVSQAFEAYLCGLIHVSPIHRWCDKLS